MDIWDFEDLSVKDIFVISGIRPSGRMVDHTANGRIRHGLLYIWNGQTVFYNTDSTTVTVNSGELVYIPKGKKYKMEYIADRTTFVLVDFVELTRDGAPAVLSSSIITIAKDDDSKRIARIMTDFELCSATQNVAALFRRKELVYKLLGAVYSSDAPRERELKRNSKILAGVRLLEETYVENLPISKFAEACHVSENTFRSLFNKQFGSSPVQYRNKLRIGRARTLISEGSCTVAEAAYSTGFDNVGYFCRLYKRLTGETPSQTRERGEE